MICLLIRQIIPFFERISDWRERVIDSHVHCFPPKLADRALHGTLADRDFEVDGTLGNPVLEKVREDLEEAGIEAVYSANIRRDTLQKFSMVSPNSAAGIYYDACAGDFQKEGEPRQMYIECIREIGQIAGAMHISFDTDLVETNLKIMDALDPSFTTSLQKDVKAGGRSEADGQIFEVVRLGRKYYIPVPAYEKAAKKLGFEEPASC